MSIHLSIIIHNIHIVIEQTSIITFQMDTSIDTEQDHPFELRMASEQAGVP